MISTWFHMMAECSKCWDPVFWSSEFQTNEKVALILLGRLLDSITYQKPGEKGPLTAKDYKSPRVCAHVTNPFW